MRQGERALVAVLAVAGILIFGGGGDKPAPKPNTVAQPTTDTSAGGSSTPMFTADEIDGLVASGTVA